MQANDFGVLASHQKDRQGQRDTVRPHRSASEASSVTPSVDTDGDGVNDLVDNCVSIANPDQEPSAINPDCGEACVTSSCAGTICVNY